MQVSRIQPFHGINWSKPGATPRGQTNVQERGDELVTIGKLP